MHSSIDVPKAKQLCEAFAKMEDHSSKITKLCKASLLSAELMVLYEYHRVLQFIHSICLKILRLPRNASEHVVFSSMFTSKRALCHSRVAFFDISLPKSGPNLRCLWRLTWRCASRHIGAQFSISHLTKWLGARCFSEPTFRPPEPQIIGKNRVFGGFSTFRTPSRLWLLAALLLHLSIGRKFAF